MIEYPDDILHKRTMTAFIENVRIGFPENHRLYCREIPVKDRNL